LNFLYTAKLNAYFRRLIFTLHFVISLVLMPDLTFAQTPLDSLTLKKLKKLSMEELMNLEVTSISMRPEKLTEVASAVQVITGEDIHRSGVTRLPEALRLAANLQMAQANSHDWAITARGFNGLPSAGGILANKLLVMVDGRSVYNPLFGGVYWDVQNVLLEDVDRVEVVSGPGGTLWGANAVNGVINVVTKSAKETQGLYASNASGSLLQNASQARYGFKVDSTIFFRVYGQRFDQRSTTSQNGRDGKDAWSMTQGGFRMDYYPSKANTLTLQGDFYGGNENDSVTHANTNGQNVLARFTHHFSDQSNLIIRAYFDRTWRKTPYSSQPFFYELNTYDFDIQHRFSIGSKHSILWGGAYRQQKDKTASSFFPPRTAPSFNPVNRDMPLYSGFVQDEIIIVPDQIKLTIGSKFLNNVFSGFEIQPSARMAWTPNKRNTVWTAVSRAVRIPTRFDSDITVTAKKFGSEKITAYEVGYRVRPVDQLSLSFATFYNQYHDLRSLDSASSPSPPIILANSQRAESWGFEFSGNFQAMDWWRLRGGVTYFDKNISPTSSKVLPVSSSFEGVDPKNVFMFQSVMDLPNNLQLDLVGRYAGILPSVAANIPTVPAYFTFGARLAWQIKSFEISLVGQNLWENQHTEVGLSKIPRSIYGKITCRF
jgi:iron complex outermembrane receptor protein